MSRKMNSPGADRYRLNISDGQFSSTFAMLGTQHNNLCDSGELANNCVIKIKRYVCNTVQVNKKVS